jgi:hypothetical protein
VQRERNWNSTAPYSPPQNGISEWMNWTIIELAHTMLWAQDLPEFLWEYSTFHAAYIRNHSYTTHLPNETPYEGWHGHKLNVLHLQEFGAPVWILLQGQKQKRKMLPKSKCQVYIGFNEGAKAVKYYNAKVCKILTSCNFHHNSVATPMDPKIKLILNPQPNEPNQSNTFVRWLRELQYVANGTRHRY